MTLDLPRIILPTILLILIGVSVTHIITDFQAFLFPSFVLILMLLSCVRWLFQGEVDSNQESVRFAPIITILLYSFSIPYVGIWVSTLLFVVILQLVLEKRPKIVNLFGSIIFASLLIVLFQRVLAITFPAGLFWS